MVRTHLAMCLFAAGLLPAARAALPAQTQFEKARGRTDSLRLGSYATSGHVEQLAVDESFRTRTWDTIRRMGITRLYVEVYRSGHTVSTEHLVFVRDWLQGNGIEVVGGIATVPGGDVGVPQEGPLDWFNWQSAKTQRDLESIIRKTAPLFDTFIIDDFLCTGDVSAESRQAKGDRSWGQYRRELMTQVARSVFIEPARQANPNITMIVKYPQWYDRFHLFGYDTQTLPRLFDRVWVGTETRGRNTQRFGFVQPYEGFVNYRWLAGIAGDKIGAAWFDHGDCAEHDFLDQAYMSVLAGARELVFFNLGDVVQGHPDHAKVVEQFDRLADLAEFVRTHPAAGVPAYKPPNSDPAGDMYLMDFLGMLGIPLVPVHEFPESASTIFLPAQAAADPNLFNRVNAALDRGTNVIVTTSLLLTLPEGGRLARMLGVDPNLRSSPTRAACVGQTSEGTTVDLESPLAADRSDDIACTAGGRSLLLFRTVPASRGRLSLLNTHTYSQADFDAVGEVLLCPRRLGLLTLGGPALDGLRAAFREAGGPSLAGPACVTLHPFSESLKNGNDGPFDARGSEFRLQAGQDRVNAELQTGPDLPFSDSASGRAGFVVQNFSDQDVTVTVTAPLGKHTELRALDRFTGQPLPVLPSESPGEILLRIPLPARGRVWIQLGT
ncbi:MAG TPA: hypothetical protein PKH24_16865 [Sedimentisphaerales bacterium]|jgi:hypothetical protein|nr:hypothetical protein [Sedimentisphaerales bacterium]HNU30524.1 hypothetical protein [Sedimentisphaerales bacterium]